VALSDVCAEFLFAFQRAAGSLAQGVHHCSAPDYPIRYGWEVDGLRKACADVQQEPFDPEAGARLLSLATAVMRFHDTDPANPAIEARKTEMNRLIRLLQEGLDEADAALVPLMVTDVVVETERTPEASKRMGRLLSKLGSDAYDTGVRILSDVGSATIKKMLGLGP
jgi:hypothetical protein